MQKGFNTKFNNIECTCSVHGVSLYLKTTSALLIYEPIHNIIQEESEINEMHVFQCISEYRQYCQTVTT